MSKKNFISYGDGETLFSQVAYKFSQIANILTGKSDKGRIITFEQWKQLTPQEQMQGSYDITGVPGADGTVSVDLMTKLWENPSPKASFAASIITGLTTLADYDFYLARFVLDTSDYAFINTICFNNELTEGLFAEVSGDANRGTTSYYRIFRVDAANNRVVFNGGYYGSTTLGRISDNAKMIPIAIYGIKSTASVKINAIAMDVSTSADKCMMSDGITSVEDAIDEVDGKIPLLSVRQLPVITVSVTAQVDSTIIVDWNNVDKSKVLYSWVHWNNPLSDIPRYVLKYYDSQNKGALYRIVHNWSVTQNVNLYVNYIYMD